MTDVRPEAYDDPFAYSLAVDSSAEAYKIVWRRWQAAAEECRRHQAGRTYDVAHEHGVLTAIKHVRSLLDEIIQRSSVIEPNHPRRGDVRSCTP